MIYDDLLSDRKKHICYKVKLIAFQTISYIIYIDIFQKKGYKIVNKNLYE